MTSNIGTKKIASSEIGFKDKRNEPSDKDQSYDDIKKYYLTFTDIINMNEEVASDFWTNPDIDFDVFALSV